jgi:hypothetical protein
MTKRIKLTFIVIRKGKDLTTIMVREDKKVMFNFGSDEWIDFSLMGKLKIKNKKYNRYIENPKFKKDYSETEKVIAENDYKGIVEKFHKDFKKDRANVIKIIESEADVDG